MKRGSKERMADLSAVNALLLVALPALWDRRNLVATRIKPLNEFWLGYAMKNGSDALERLKADEYGRISDELQDERDEEPTLTLDEVREMLAQQGISLRP